MTARPKQKPSTVDDAEVARFAALAAEWWDASGPMAPLHRLNPVRLGWIKDQICTHLSRDPKDAEALKGLRILDVGCGGGIVSEPLRRMGAEVVGIDPAAENIAVARLHAREAGLAIDYRATTAEALAAGGERFDVGDRARGRRARHRRRPLRRRLRRHGEARRPDDRRHHQPHHEGLCVAIIGAEYILRWLPRGTHSYDKLVKPSELAAAFRAAGLLLAAETGIMYVPLADRWRLTSDMDVNYMMSAVKPS